MTSPPVSRTALDTGASPAARPLAFRTLIPLMPAAFAVHIAEEYGTGFPAWVSAQFGSPMTGAGFLVNNALFMVILAGLTLWAVLRPSFASRFLLLSWASGNLFWNFVFHLVTTALFDRLSPGLVTAVLLYYPLSLLVAVAAWRERVLPVPALLGAAAIGAGLMLFVMWAGLLHPLH